jgi:DNA-binding LytR/AlgR family response regulator
MKFLVVEDEKLAAERLIAIVKELVNDAELAGHTDSVKSTVRWLQSNSAPDLIFMDIQLADGLSFKIFELHKVEVPVIFTTAYNEFAIKAFKVNSIDYLLKPIDKEELGAAIGKFQRIYSRGDEKVDYDRKTMQKILQLVSNPYKARFVVKVGEHLRHISTSDIAFFHSLEKETYLNTHGGKSYGLEYSLDEVEELTDAAIFFRVNRKYIVSLKAIKDIIAYSGSRLKLKINDSDLDDVLVSREKVAEFKSWLEGERG